LRETEPEILTIDVWLPALFFGRFFCRRRWKRVTVRDWNTLARLANSLNNLERSGKEENKKKNKNKTRKREMGALLDEGGK
jgi:hypothetical protein